MSIQIKLFLNAIQTTLSSAKISMKLSIPIKDGDFRPFQSKNDITKVETDGIITTHKCNTSAGRMKMNPMYFRKNGIGFLYSDNLFRMFFPPFKFLAGHNVRLEAICMS